MYIVQCTLRIALLYVDPINTKPYEYIIHCILEVHCVMYIVHQEI